MTKDNRRQFISPGLRGGASVQPSVIAGIVAVRYILLPSVGTVLIKTAVRFGIIQPDPLYQFILLLQYAVPPAMNIGQSVSQTSADRDGPHACW